MNYLTLFHTGEVFKHYGKETDKTDRTPQQTQKNLEAIPKPPSR
jgi:hypothetical protein